MLDCAGCLVIILVCSHLKCNISCSNLRFLKVLLQVKFSSSDESSNDGHNVCVHKFNDTYYCNDDHRPIRQVSSDFVEKNVCLVAIRM